MKERDINFFRPLWRRVAVLTVCVVWAGLEVWHGEQLWIMITLGITAYAAWNFFIAFDRHPPPPTPPQETSKSEGGDVPPQA